ncbi:MAG: endonuclease III [Deltaproteobacteria bacterium]|nr:endonuclease III [Candidatus Zymogenaceae bacterium]
MSAQNTAQNLEKKVQDIYGFLDIAHPEAGCALNFSTPLELLIASILSAQCTDERVNTVTEKLFQKYTLASDYAQADIETLEEEVHPTGFYRNKAKAIKDCTIALVERFDGSIPDTMEDLVSLPGIGRKTANLVRSCAFKMPGIIVDTHVLRLSGRLGLSDKKNADRVEMDLRAITPEDRWSQLSYLLIFHGRKICKAKKPLCEKCPVTDLCVYFGERNAPV